MAVKPIPEGYHSITPYLAVEDAGKAIDFYKEAFGAEELMRMPGPDGKIAHAEIQIGDSKLMLSDPFEQSSVQPPAERGGTTGSIFLYVDDVDSTFEQATEAGGHGDLASGGHVLGRPLRDGHRPVRARLVDGDAQGRPDRGADGRAQQGCDGRDGFLARRAELVREDAVLGRHQLVLGPAGGFLHRDQVV